MPLAITLRTRGEVSPFRRQVLRLVRTPQTDVLFLCSGFFSTFILDDELVEAIKNNCTRVVVIGGYLRDKNGNLDPEKQQKFDKFVQELRTRDIDAVQYQAEHLGWHSKIALRMRQNIPVAAIIGSSNLTGPSVSEVTNDWWNYESDVTIWLPENDLDLHFRRLEPEIGPHEVAFAVLDNSVKQPNEAERLQALFQETWKSESHKQTQETRSRRAQA